MRSAVEKAPHLAAAARVLELAERLGLDLPNALARQRERLAEFLQRMAIMNLEVVAIPKTHLRGRAKEDVRVALINGDCMISKGVRGLPKSIAHGDQIAYDTASLSPQHHDIVVCFDHQEDKLIVKLFTEQETDSDFIVLYPANPNHPPVVRPKDDPQLSLRGVVFWRGGNIW